MSTPLSHTKNLDCIIEFGPRSKFWFFIIKKYYGFRAVTNKVVSQGLNITHKGGINLSSNIKKPNSSHKTTAKILFLQFFSVRSVH